VLEIVTGSFIRRWPGAATIGFVVLSDFVSADTEFGTGIWAGDVDVMSDDIQL
jgi:hypothetical protein